MNQSFSSFKSYLQLILKNHSSAFESEMLTKVKASVNPPLNSTDLAEMEIVEILQKTIQELFIKALSSENPAKQLKEDAAKWHQNNWKESVTLKSILSFSNIQKRSLINFTNCIHFSKNELFELVNEIEDFFEVYEELMFRFFETADQKKYHQNQEILSGILTNVPIIVTKLDKSGNILYSSGSGLQAMGLKDNELTGTNVFEQYPNSQNTKQALQGKKISFTGTAQSLSGDLRRFQTYYIPTNYGALGFSMDITQQKETEGQFINLVEGIKDYAIFLLNRDGTVASWNEGAKVFKGYTRDEILGKHFSIFYPEEKKQARFPEYELEQAIKFGRFEDEGYRVRKDGTLFWANVVITTIYNHQKEVTGFTKITRDLSERKEAEEALRESEDRFRNLIEGVKDYAIYMLNPDGTVASWNEGAYFFKGYTKSEIIGKHFSIFYPKEKTDAKYPEFELEMALMSGRFEDEGYRVRKDGTLFWANVIITPIYNDSKSLIGFSKVTRDLTERRKSEEILRQSEERYRLIIEAVKDYAIFMIDSKGYISSWNEGARRLNGYSEEEAIGQHISIFYTQEKNDRNFAQYELDHAFKNGRFEDEGYRVKKDGSMFWAKVTITALFDKDNEHLGFSKIIHDLTERKLYEEKLVKLNEDLEKKVNQRTEALSQSIEELTKINNDLDNFVYTASHDLKAPMSNIEGLLLTLKDSLQFESGNVNEETETILQLMEKSIGRFKTTILDLTEITKAQKGGEEELQELNVYDIYEDIKLSIQDKISETGANIKVDFSSIDKLRFTRKNLKSIIYNLFSNALKYRDPSRILEIMLRTEISDEYNILIISDNGLGISEPNIGRMFTMFKRFHDHVEGSGIGLYIVKRIIDNAGGKIEVASELGKGTTFKVFFKK